MTTAYFEAVREHLLTLNLEVEREDEAEALFVVHDESRGIANLLVDCEDELLVIEQPIMKVPGGDAAMFRRLLEMNRTMVHGAFVVDAETELILFRDTLQLANLDLNELDASINALRLALAEHGGELIAFAQGGQGGQP